MEVIREAGMNLNFTHHLVYNHAFHDFMTFSFSFDDDPFNFSTKVAPAVYGMEIIACLMCMSHLVFSLIKNEFSTDYALGIEGFIDSFTITPLLLQGAPGGTWLTIAYLRTYRTKTAFYRLCATGILEPCVACFWLVWIL